MPWVTWTIHLMRPEGPRDTGWPEVSRPFRPLLICLALSQGIGPRPKPWAEIYRPVGPGSLETLEQLQVLDQGALLAVVQSAELRLMAAVREPGLPRVVQLRLRPRHIALRVG